MKIIGNSLQRGFLIKYEGKNYYANYLDADYSFSALLNRDNWEVIEEDGEEISPYMIKLSKNKKETKLYYKLINFCIKNFNQYKPKVSIL